MEKTKQRQYHYTITVPISFSLVADLDWLDKSDEEIYQIVEETLAKGDYEVDFNGLKINSKKIYTPEEIAENNKSWDEFIAEWRAEQKCK